MTLPGEIDWRVLALSAGVCLISTLLLGLVPAIQTSKIDLAGALKSEMAGVVGGGHGKSWLRSGLVVLQVSLSFLLLVGTGLLMQSLQRIRNLNPGFSTQGVLFTAVDLRGAGYDPQRAKTFDDALLEARPGPPRRRVRGPRAKHAVELRQFFFLGHRRRWRSTPPTSSHGQYNQVGPAYFSTMGIPLLPAANSPAPITKPLFPSP